MMKKTVEGNPLSAVLRYRAPLAAISLTLVAVPGLAPVLADDLGASETVSQWADNIALLAGKLRAEVTRLPSDSSSESFEAALLFLIEQSGEPENVVCSALEAVRVEATTPPAAQTAMVNICRQVSGRRGTGAIPNSGTAFAASSFSAPIISTGGGSSSYTS